MGDGKTNDNKCLSEKLSDQVRHLPALVLPINEIPYTVNGKKVSALFLFFRPSLKDVETL